MVTTNSRSRLTALLAAMLVMASVLAATPASAARSKDASSPGPSATGVGKFSLFVHDINVATQTPISKALVVIYNQDMLVLDGYTNEAGFYVGTLKAGTYLVNVSAEDYKLTTTKLVVKSGSATELAVGLTKEELTGTGKLGVAVYGSAGPAIFPISGAIVVVYNSKGVAVLKGMTDKTGLFTTELNTGVYTLNFFADGFMPTKAEVLVKGGEAIFLEVEMLR